MTLIIALGTDAAERLDLTVKARLLASNQHDVGSLRCCFLHHATSCKAYTSPLAGLSSSQFVLHPARCKAHAADVVIISHPCACQADATRSARNHNNFVIKLEDSRILEVRPDESKHDNPNNASKHRQCNDPAVHA